MYKYVPGVFLEENEIFRLPCLHEESCEYLQRLFGHWERQQLEIEKQVMERRQMCNEINSIKHSLTLP